jgi:hypothetical protein
MGLWASTTLHLALTRAAALMVSRPLLDGILSVPRDFCLLSLILSSQVTGLGAPNIVKLQRILDNRNLHTGHKPFDDKEKDR